MTQEISSLMDGELTGEEAGHVIKTQCGHAEVQVDWHLYHLIGDAMRGHSVRSVALPTPVIEALRSQPTVLAPRRSVVTFTRVALAAAASVATIGVVGWIGSQGGQGSAVPIAAKASSAIQPVSNTVPAREAATPIDVQAYLNAHRQLPTPEQYRPANSRAPAAAAR